MTFFLPEAALDQHIAILGKTGSGKTWTAKLIVEHVLRRKRQVCILDPTGAWFGLRLAADGRGKGLDVVLLGGEHADIPLAERSGAAVARLVTEQGASVVLDTSGLTVGEYTRWFIDFAGTLYTTLRNPLHLVIDEAHYFMPQGRVPDPDAGRMLHAGNRLMSGGRSRGVRGLLITQRPAKLHKDALTCADTLIAMRVIAPQDRNAVKDWIDGCGNATDGKMVLDSLAVLKRGEGWVWYPEGSHLKRETFSPITTYDSSAAPKDGAKLTPNLSAIDLSEVKKALADAVKDAEANDPKLLRRKVAELEKQLRERSPEMKPVIERVEVPVLKNGQLNKALSLVERLEGIVGPISEAVKKVTMPAAQAKPAVTVQSRPVPMRQPVRQPVARQEGKAVGGGLRRMLIALAQRPGLNKKQLGVRAGLSSSSGTFTTYLGTGRSEGWIEGTGDSLRITDAGLRELGPFDPLPTGHALLEHWTSDLGGGMARLLQAAAEAYPEALSKDQLAEAAGLTAGSGTFTTYLGKLRTLELIEGRGEIRASAEFFA